MGEDRDPSKILEIDADLYRRIREYCDREELRFLAFIEDILEEAVSPDPKEESFDYARAFRRGFQQGVFSALLVAQGNLGTAESLGPVPPDPFKPVTGPQLSLFGDDPP